MYFYALADGVLASQIAMPELIPVAGKFPSIRFRISPPGSHAVDPDAWLRTVASPDGNPWVSIGRAGHGYLLRYFELADFILDSSAGEIVCHPFSDTPEETVRHLLLDQVLPLVLQHRGATILHASAVAVGNSAVAFVGSSGSGKSTLAASLCQQGSHFIADDCLFLKDCENEFHAMLIYPGFRLWESSTEQFKWRSGCFSAVANYTEKKRVPLAEAGLHFVSEPLPLSAIFILNPGLENESSVDISRLSPTQALMELVGASFCLDPTNRGRNEKEFQRLARLAETIPVLRMKYPHDFARLGELREAVLSAPSCL